MTSVPERLPGRLERALNGCGRVLSLLLSIPIRLYQRLISPLKPPTCRFRPTCSSYALEALRVRGPIVGSWLAVRRILRCHPFTEPGPDPVPRRRSPR